MSSLKPLKIDIVSDVVCPWCYIGKRRIENALALVPDVPVEVRWRPFLSEFLGAARGDQPRYLTAKFGSPEAYKGIAGRVPAADEEGLLYRPDLVKRQPNTIDCHRLIHWAEAQGRSAEMKQRLMELYFRDGGDLTDIGVLVQAAADIGLDADEVRRRLLATDECRRADFGAGTGSRRQGHLRRADLRVRAEIRGVRRATRRAARPRHPPGLGGSECAGGGIKAGRQMPAKKRILGSDLKKSDR